jgi:DNA-entry nuclease
VFKGTELLARGVEMEAQSVGPNAVRYHVYVFNVQPGVKLNYKDGTSVVSGIVRKAKKAYVAKKKTVKKVVKKKVQYKNLCK